MRRNRISPRHSLLDRGPMLTPLIDIMFLVLIFFMVNNGPNRRSLGVQPPHMPGAPEQPSDSPAPPGAEPVADILFLALRPDLSYSIQLQSSQDSSASQEWYHSAKPSDDKSAPDGTGQLKRLEQSLAELRSRQAQQQTLARIRRIRLRADRSLDYGTVIAVCGLLYRWQLPLDLDLNPDLDQNPDPDL
ncbi:biopolymer transporter ExbD [Candidatus Haliotispira prima]|uniref:Biopolymer transporter ExbD n=1 Tax=Candidatus Haliotispira prima TaxID=3034016 RepID=A0ABY8MJ42_9SPIO|nr:biopolymer transporter ExbD [Candidatus Haliotispira prima]